MPYQYQQTRPSSPARLIAVAIASRPMNTFAPHRRTKSAGTLGTWSPIRCRSKFD